MTLRKTLFTCLLLFIGISSYAQRLDHELGDVLVRLSENVTVEDIAEKFTSFEGVETDIQIKYRVSRRMDIWLIHIDPNKIDEHAFLWRLKSDPLIHTAQFNHLLEKRETVPDDLLFGEQWHWVNTGQTGGFVDADVDADLAWDITTGGLTANGDTIVVAVVDDGIDLSHEDFQRNTWVNRFEIPGNGVDDDNNGYIDDVYGWNTFGDDGNVDGGGHGVSVNGMIGADGNNMIGVTGMNWDVKIMGIVGGNPNDEANVIAGYSYALDHRIRYNETDGAEGAFVVATNSSWGLDFGDPEDAPLWCAFYDTLGMHGILSCGATANLNIDIDIEGDLPTACPSEFMIAVTATNDEDVRTFSGFGEVQIDVGAPGASVYTTSAGSTYGPTSGTSFASPLTAGIIALLYSAPCSNIADLAKAAPDEAARQVRDYIFEGVDKIDNLADETKYGGRVNAYNSLMLLLDNCGPCPPPAKLEANNLTDVFGQLSWINNDSILTNDMRWRKLGDTIWNEVPGATSPVDLTELMACTEYEFQVKGFCQDTMSNYSNSKIFKTDGCCELPDEFELIDLDESTATLTWGSVLAAQTFVIQYKIVDSTEWIDTVVSETAIMLQDLEPCAFYEARISTDCDTAMTDFSEMILFRTKGCGNCIDLEYCTGEWNANFTWIDTFMVESINNPSGNNAGYAFFEEQVATFYTEQSYDVTHVQGNGFFEPENWMRVWIDYNQDGVFNDSTELALDGGAFIGTFNGTMTIPADALPGSTRMRVAQKATFGGYNPPPLACEDDYPGEVEDYCVEIIESNPPCPPAADIDALNITFTSSFMVWELVENSIVFTYRYRVVGDEEWIDELAVIDTFAVLEELSDCKDYEFQLRTVCPADTSGYSESFIFSTDCTNTATNDLDELVNSIVVYPNPFAVAPSILIDTEQLGDYEVRVHNIQGQVVMQDNWYIGYNGEHQRRLDQLSQAANGTYILVLEHEGKRLTRKILKI